MSVPERTIEVIRSTQKQPGFTWIGDYDSEQRFYYRSSYLRRCIVGSYCCYQNMLDPETACGCEKLDLHKILEALGLTQLYEQIEARAEYHDFADLR